jgi:phosphate transport system permease protein
VLSALIASGAVVALAVMAIEVFRAALPAIDTFGLGFLTSTEWDRCGTSTARCPTSSAPWCRRCWRSSSRAGGAGVAVFLSELAPDWLRRPLGFTVELLAAIPSVVYGLWGIFVVAPGCATTCSRPRRRARLPAVLPGPPRGFGMLAAGVILAIMILPTIASISRTCCAPRRCAARGGAGAGRHALGGHRHALLPFVRSGSSARSSSAWAARSARPWR